MERFAILIESSNVKGLKDLPGARADVEQWQFFLKSKLGGLWSNEEFCVLSKPYSSDIETLLESNRNKYCYVAFSGHGYHDNKSNKSKICLNDILQDYDVSNLRPKGTKGTLLIDACRGVESGQRKVLIEESRIKIAADSKYAEFSKAFFHEKEIWFNNLNSSNNGTATLFSCNIGESAGEFEKEDPNQGGYFTTIMMLTAQNWEKTANSRSCYSTKDAYNATEKYMKINFPNQKPVYDPSYVAFPFAVKG